MWDSSQHEKFPAVEIRTIHVLVDENLNYPLVEGGHKEPADPVDNSEAGDDEEKDPPEPEDSKVILVEQIVGQDTQMVFAIHVTSYATYFKVAGYLKISILEPMFLKI